MGIMVGQLLIWNDIIMDFRRVHNEGLRFGDYRRLFIDIGSKRLLVKERREMKVVHKGLMFRVKRKKYDIYLP